MGIFNHLGLCLRPIYYKRLVKKKLWLEIAVCLASNLNCHWDSSTLLKLCLLDKLKEEMR